MPVAFCACAACTSARMHRGRNLRRRSSITVNGDLLVDIGPDITTSSFEYDIPLSGIAYCLQTHFHEDHFDPEIIIARHAEYGTTVYRDLLVAASRETLKMMDLIIGRRCGYGSIFDPKTQAALGIRLLPVSPFRQYDVGSYKVTGLPANHGSGQGCMIYSIRDGGNALLYATDTSTFLEEIWEHLERSSVRYDLVILDHTYGMGYESKPGDHLAAGQFIGHVERLIGSGILKEDGRVFGTHFSHVGMMEHSRLEDFAKPHGYSIAYDGLRLALQG